MSDVRSTTMDLADSLRGVPIPFAGKLSRLPSRALVCNGATPNRASYPELHEVMYIEESCDLNSTTTVTMDDTSEVSPDDSVEGFGIPTGTTVASVDSATQITLSAAATQTQTGVTLRFYAWGNGDGSTTFDLPDLRGAFLRGAGSHGTETMADGNPFAGPAVGAFEDDQMQGHKHTHANIRTASDQAWSPSLILTDGIDNDPGNTSSTRGPSPDGINGTPRTGDETRPFSVGVNYIIFY